jgi:pyruvate,water dikinase
LASSNAGQFLSLVVHDQTEFATAVRRVALALPHDEQGRPLGVVFVQPLVRADQAGVALTDGFYFERSLSSSGVQDLTAGRRRGVVTRGHLARAEPWSDWLAAIYAVFGAGPAGARCLDIEFAQDARGYVLLQVRPALFPVRRNETISLANHKETMGDPPSPWTVSSFVEAGRDLSFLETIDPIARAWDDVHALDLGERAWLNLSFWYRWVDHLGLPRTFLSEGLGGDPGPAADGWTNWGRVFRKLRRLARLQLFSMWKIHKAAGAMRRLDAAIEGARGLDGLYRVTVAAQVLMLHTTYAIFAVCSGLVRLRRLLHLPGAAHLVTQEMMEEYQKLARLPSREEREAGLKSWLKRYGHRGPLESDLARPRFAEMGEVLQQDLEAAARQGEPREVAPSRRQARSLLPRFLWPLYHFDERREWFRDAMMRRWQRLRERIRAEGARLAAAGRLEEPEDVFWLRGTDLPEPKQYRAAVAARKARAREVQDVDLPLTTTREAVEEVLAGPGHAQYRPVSGNDFAGIALHSVIVEGRAVKADDLTTLLRHNGTVETLGPEAILVVPSLEPSWAVVFPRVAGVVSELGGELSHASILLREARRPAVVNCAGIYARVRNGDRLRLDGVHGRVEILSAG